MELPSLTYGVRHEGRGEGERERERLATEGLGLFVCLPVFLFVCLCVCLNGDWTVFMLGIDDCNTTVLARGFPIDLIYRPDTIIVLTIIMLEAFI